MLRLQLSLYFLPQRILESSSTSYHSFTGMFPEAVCSDSSNTRDLHSAVLQATLEEVSSRPTDVQQGASADDCCVICLDEIKEGCEAQPCHHRHFDYLCLVTWLDQQEACPLCKIEIKEVRYDFSDDRKQWKTYELPVRPPPKAKLEETARPVRRYYAQVRPRHRINPHSSYRTFAPSQDEAIARRRAVYRHQLYSLHVGSNRISRYRDLTPQMFASDPELVSRARTFLRRELQVFEFLSPENDARSSQADPVQRRRANNAEFLLEYIVAILKTVDMQGSMGQAEELIQEFLGREDTRLLLHELRAWLRSPYMTLENWDRAVQYSEVAPTRRRSQSPAVERGGSSASGAGGASGDGIYPSRWRRNDRQRHPRGTHEARRSRNRESLREATERYSVD